ncbi:MAG: 16S rRNA (guanine(527)-N(7))-methyltransferase RsmG [Clostridia bacterium]|nr:16S rRNA (guanine(527)-N(7))-methyltransferase RsmG [Clostridia bacterium]
MGDLFRHALTQGLKELDLTVHEEKIEKLTMYKYLLLSWNEHVNLTAILEPEEVAIKHFIDSLALSCFIDFKNDQKMIDVGSGAGFPGLPLKIVFPEVNVTLLDSLQKRCDFLLQLVSKLNLTGIQVVHGRAEEKGQDILMREEFDFAIARAVTQLPVLVEYCLPFVKKGGLFFAFKGPGVEKELESAQKAISLLGGLVREVKKYRLPVSGEERSLVIIEKENNTDKRYPRRPGIPGKKPLI